MYQCTKTIFHMPSVSVLLRQFSSQTIGVNFQPFGWQWLYQIEHFHFQTPSQSKRLPTLSVMGFNLYRRPRKAAPQPFDTNASTHAPGCPCKPKYLLQSRNLTTRCWKNTFKSWFHRDQGHSRASHFVLVPWLSTQWM